VAVFAYGKYFDDPAVLSYYHDTEFLKTAPLLRPSLAEERGRLTQTLTQTTQKMGGNNGVDAPKEQLRPEQTGLSSHVCAYFCSLILILDRELQKSRSKRYKACSDVAETVGFEPTCGYPRTDFERWAQSHITMSGGFKSIKMCYFYDNSHFLL